LRRALALARTIGFCASLARWGGGTTIDSRPSLSHCRLWHGRSSLVCTRFFGYFFVVSLVWLSGGLGLGVRGHARAPARVRRLVFRRRRFGCLNCCTCVCMLVARSHSCRRLASVLSRSYGAPRVGLLGTGVVARARVHALLVGACFLVRLIVEHGCCCVRTPTARHRSCFRWGGRSCRVAQAARACVPALCGICTRVAVWSLGWPLGHQGTPKTQ